MTEEETRCLREFVYELNLQPAKLYGFWNFSVLGDEKREVDRYCNLLFHMVFKNRARQLLGD